MSAAPGTPVEDEGKKKGRHHKSDAATCPPRRMETFPDIDSIDPMLVLKFNVGGVKFQTTFPTLRKASANDAAAASSGSAEKKESFFARILTGAVAVPRDDEGAFFIDRDPNLFAPLLEFLRTGKYHAPQSLLDAVYREAVFYGIELPTSKIFEKENEYRTEVAALPAGSKAEAVQALICDKETQGFTFINAAQSKDSLLLFFRQ
eukprot:m51a1_g8282 hypothetical protein (205) ;mRNA; r:101927-102858